MNSIDAVDEVLSVNPTVAFLRAFSFSLKTRLQDRIESIDERDAALIANAIAQKAVDKTQFWDALLTGFVRDGEYSTRLISEVFFHQANRDYHYINRSDFRTFFTGRSDNLWALNSKVILRDGASLHIPLLDFKIASQRRSDGLVKECVEALGLRGFLMDSGKSYHFIGLDLVGESEMLNLLAKFILLHPISDKAWAAHQILERSASLRITKKNTKEPILVCRIA